MGYIVHDNWFTTLEAVSVGMTPQATIRSNCCRIIQEHLKLSGVQEHDVCNRRVARFVYFSIEGFTMYQSV